MARDLKQMEKTMWRANVTGSSTFSRRLLHRRPFKTAASSTPTTDQLAASGDSTCVTAEMRSITGGLSRIGAIRAQSARSGVTTVERPGALAHEIGYSIQIQKRRRSHRSAPHVFVYKPNAISAQAPSSSACLRVSAQARRASSIRNRLSPAPAIPCRDAGAPFRGRESAA